MKQVAGRSSSNSRSTARWRRSRSSPPTSTPTQQAARRGERLTELLKQPQYEPIPVEKQVISSSPAPRLPRRARTVNSHRSVPLAAPRRDQGARAGHSKTIRTDREIKQTDKATTGAAGRPRELHQSRYRSAGQPGTSNSMACLKAIRRRIVGQITRKITSAMKMVAASGSAGRRKLRKRRGHMPIGGARGGRRGGQRHR